MTTAASSPRRRLGKYELVARIGEGGMAEVHLARMRGLRQFEKLVVVKTVRPSLASRPELASMLMDEARIAALVKHPNVVDIYDLGEEDGTLFIAMEYLEGESLGAVLRASRLGPRLDPFSTARIIADGAAGLHAAHELRSLAGEPLELVHQDVTPGNVIVLYTGQVKLVDFGVAKVRTTADDGLLKGKTGYLSPELLDGAPANRQSDVFSLGVVLWESLTLRRLFSGKTEDEALAKIRACDVPPPSRFAAAVPRDLDDVCFTALAKDPARRYRDAAAMQADLTQILRHASWSGGSEPIGRFMRTLFADRIAARATLLRELATSKGPRPGTLDRIQAIRDDGAATPPAAVVGSHGAERPELPADDLRPRTPLATVAMPTRARRPWRTAVAIAVAVGLVVGLVVALSLGGGDGSQAAAAGAGVIDAGLRHGGSPDAAVAVAVVVVDAGVAVADHVDAAPVMVPAGDGAAREAAAQQARRDRGRVPAVDHRRDAGPEPAREAVPTSVTARSLYKDGLKRFVAGDVDGALALFQDAAGRDGKYAPIHRGLGMAYEKRGDRRRAARAFETYLKLSPDADDAASIRARLEKLR